MEKFYYGHQYSSKCSLCHLKFRNFFLVYVETDTLFRKYMTADHVQKICIETEKQNLIYDLYFQPSVYSSANAGDNC